LKHRATIPHNKNKIKNGNSGDDRDNDSCDNINADEKDATNDNDTNEYNMH
jgi:hypothetical protein